MEILKMDPGIIPVQDTVNKQHVFSKPWEDSDVVLVVEDQKFHVHRMMLSMASPVFKVMFSSTFKEKDQAEIELHEKKANEMLDLLKQVYPQEQGDITTNNVEYIAKLADEYQMRGVLLLCEKFLLGESKTKKTHLLKYLQLAQQYYMTNMEEKCYKELKEMRIAEMQGLEGFEHLDGDDLRGLLVPKIEELEQLLEDIYPQFTGAIDLAMELYQEKDERPMKTKTCPLHYVSNKFVISMQERLKDCVVCKEMLKNLALDSSKSKFLGGTPLFAGFSTHHHTPFNQRVISVLQEMATTLNLDKATMYQ